MKLVQQAMDYANANKVDSADMVAQQALRISPTAPYSHLVLGNVAAARLKNMDAIRHYKDALEEASKDTIFADVRRTILYTLGNFANDAAAVDSVAKNRDMYYAEAKSACEALSKDPGKQYANAARQCLTAALRGGGDTTAIKNACQDQLKNPDSFDFLALVQCGVTLAEVKDYMNATKLFQAATTQNPYHRDGLYNLGLMHVEIGEQLQKMADSIAAIPTSKKDTVTSLEASAMKEFQGALQTTDRLVAIDPSNPDNIRLWVHGHNGIRKFYISKAKAFGDSANMLSASKKAVDIAHRRALIDSAAKMDPLQRAALNKVVDLNTKADSMPVKVEFSEFTPGTAKTTLSGTILNRTEKEQSYTLNIEFLDKSGQVVGSGKASVDAVRPHSKGNFTVAGTAPGIVAFRYAPLG